VRNFVYTDINTLRACLYFPHHDPERPCVNAWFASSDGATVDEFLPLLGESHQDRLEAEGGACIVYTRLADGFCVDGRLAPTFRRLMTRLAAKPGWFVPVSTLLDHLQAQSPDSGTITGWQRDAWNARGCEREDQDCAGAVRKRW
jgi:hypothetical protein